MKDRNPLPPAPDEKIPSSLRGPLVRWWNGLPLPVRTGGRLLWKNRTVRWIVIALIVIFFGSLLAQFLGLTNTLLLFVTKIIGVVVDTPVGRFVALNVVLIALTLFLYGKFRAQTRYLLAARAVDRYLQALRHMVHKRFAVARRDLQSVSDSARLVDLHTAVAGFPELHEDALLKLAFCHAELGEIPQGMRCLETVPRASLPPRMARTFDEVHALLYDQSDDFLPETKAAELAKALAGDQKNVRLLAALVRRQEEMGQFEESARTQKKLIAVRGQKTTYADRRRLAFLHYRHAEQLLAPPQASGSAGRAGAELPTATADDLARLPFERRKGVITELNRAIKADPEFSLPYLLLGHLHAAAGELGLALETWGRHPSPPAMVELRKILAASTRNPKELYRDVVAAFPTAGALLAIADHAHSEGDEAMAAKILERLSAEGITSPAQELLHGDVLAAAGKSEAAEARYQAGLEAFLHG